MHAGKKRLRPIMMTTFALIAGMLPVAIGLGEGGELRADGRHHHRRHDHVDAAHAACDPVLLRFHRAVGGFFKKRLGGRSRGALVGAVLTGLVGVVLAIGGLPAPRRGRGDGRGHRPERVGLRVVRARQRVSRGLGRDGPAGRPGLPDPRVPAADPGWRAAGELAMGAPHSVAPGSQPDSEPEADAVMA